MRDWKEVKLGEIVDINPENYSSQDEWKYINYLDTSNLTEGKIDCIQKIIPGVEKIPSRAKRKIRLNDILISTVRPNQKHYGIMKKVYDNMLVSTGFAVLRPKTNVVNPYFLYAYISQNDITDYLSNVAEDSTTAYPSITPNVIADLDIFLPPLPEQKAIADILGSLDDKIELLHRQNKTLEALAETVFRKWFVEEASDEWEEKALDEVADFLNGLPLQKYPPDESGYLPVIKIKELRNGITESTDKASVNIPKQYIINNGDIIFSWSGSLEVDLWKYGKGALNQHLFKVTSEKYPKWFYYYWIKNYLPEFRDIAQDKATTMGHIQRHHLQEAKVIVPPEETMYKLNYVFEPLLNKIISNNEQIHTLEKLRDTLLPKLISGEIRVKD